MTPLAALSVLLLGLASCEGGLDSSEPFAAGDSEPLTGGGSCEDDLSGRTVGLLACDPRTEGGYTLFAPLGGHGVYLIDQGGNEVHRWNSWTTPGASIYLLPNGHLLRTGSMPPTDGTMQYPAGQGGVVEEVTWEGQTVWSFRYSSDRVYQHHDVEPLPDGNVLILAWEVRSAAQAEARGRRPELMSADELWPDHVVEYDPQQDAIVWSWHLWDHLIQNVDLDLPDYGDPADHPERLDINAIGDGPAPQGVDWNHTNAVDYNPELDQIVLSAHAQNELWVIDHSTTEEEAASHTGGRSGRGGDLLYRWGNPKHYGRGGNGDRQLQGQHDVQWIEDGLPGAGDLLIFDNNAGEDWSAIKQITPPVREDGRYGVPDSGPWGPASPNWTYEADDPTDFFSFFISGVQRLPGGNTFICEGASGRFFEVTPDGDIVWEYVNPAYGDTIIHQGQPPPITQQGLRNAVFRATRIPADHPALQGRDLTPKGAIEG